MPAWPKAVKFTHLKGALTMKSGTATSGMCFHRAAAMVLDIPGSVLCFGTFQGGTPEQCAADPRTSSVPFIHAWVEWRGMAFAPTTFEQVGHLAAMPPDGYYAVNGARNIKRLQRPELLRIARATGLSAHLRRNADLKGSFIKAMLDAVGIAFTVHDDGGILPAEEVTAHD